MNPNDTIKKQFFELSTNIEYINANFLEIQIEPYLDEALNFVLEHPEAKQEIMDAFIQITSNPNLGPPELIYYCMHALKWSELKDYFNKWLMSEKSERVRHILRSIIWSFDDDWDYADFYERFKQK